MSGYFLPQELIRKKRDGQILTDAEIGFLVQGISDSSLSDAQLGAFAMAVFHKGMNMDERISLTQHMMHSGSILQWQDLNLNGPVVDKHSTGGVGDKVSLMLAAIVAACGGYVPMISGRGLGHTGGTLDKLESIPGYNATPDEAQFRHTVQKVGCAIIGQTAQLAPADQRFYATRDVTATVESISLITASILSKKLASGLDALVMDVKTGSGAFADTYNMAQELAQSIADVATGSGVPTRCLITDMNQVLGRSVGNAVEVLECIDFLVNPTQADKRLLQITLDLAAHMLQISDIEADLSTARVKAQKALESGNSAEIFGRMVSELGGPNDLLQEPNHYLKPMSVIKPIIANKTGYISAMDVRGIGMSMVSLKAGRTKAADSIDHGVGLTNMAQIGERVEIGQPVAYAHVHRDADAIQLQRELTAFITITNENPQEKNIVYEVLTAQKQG
jgi:thymidine phosphorylase